MSYRPRYTVEMACNPTIPGVTTVVEQKFDGTQLTDKYIKRFGNALRRHGTLPRYGGMYPLAVMLAKQLGVSEPLGFHINKWSNSAYIMGSAWDKWPHSTEAFADFIKLSDVRAKTLHAAGHYPPYLAQSHPDPSQWHYGFLIAAGWLRGSLQEFRATLKDVALVNVPNYLEDMGKIADFLETRPTFNVMERKQLEAVGDARNRKNAIVK